MAAIVRVKRRIDDDPVDSLIISCKRFKQTDENIAEKDAAVQELKSLFKFAATVPEQEGNIAQHIRDAIRKEKLQREYKHHNVPVDISSRARRQHRLAVRHSRYQVVAHKRALQLEGLDAAEAQNRHNERQAAINAMHPQNVDDVEEGLAANKRKDSGDDVRETKKLFCLYDVVANSDDTEVKESRGACGGAEASANPDHTQTITCNSVAMIRERVKNVIPEYVYDLYYMNNPDFDFRALENVLAIEARDQVDYVHEMPDCEDVYDDEDDSNDEGNWRNDYPDEDPKFYENDDAEYLYGYDGNEFSVTHGSDEDIHGLSSMVTTNLRFDGGGAEGEYSSDEDEHLVNGADFSPDAHSQDNWVPSRSYEQYMAKVMKDLGEQLNDGEENG